MLDFSQSSNGRFLHKINKNGQKFFLNFKAYTFVNAVILRLF